MISTWACQRALAMDSHHTVIALRWDVCAHVNLW